MQQSENVVVGHCLMMMLCTKKYVGTQGLGQTRPLVFWTGSFNSGWVNNSKAVFVGTGQAFLQAFSIDDAKYCKYNPHTL